MLRYRVRAPGAIDCDLAEPALAETKAILEQMGRGGSAPMRCCRAGGTNIGATGAPKVAWVMERMRGLYQFRRRCLKARGGYLADDGSQDRSLAYQRLVRELLEAQRREIVRLRNRGEISNEVMHRIERDLDLEDARLEI